MHAVSMKNIFLTITGAMTLGFIQAPTVSVAAPLPKNLVDNGGFEHGMQDWQNYGSSATVAQTGAHSGQIAMIVPATGGAVCKVDHLVPNTTYTMCGYARVEKTGEQARFTVQGYGDSPVSVAVDSTNYTLKTITFTATKPTAEIAFWKDSGSGSAWCDDVALVAGLKAGGGDSASPSVESLLSDKGFESGALGQWMNYGTPVSVVQENVHSGKYAVKIAPTGGGVYQVNGLTPNTKYTFSGWAKVSAGETMRLTVSGYGAEDKSDGVTSTDYTEHSVAFTTGPTTTSVKVVFWKDAGTAPAFVDDLTLKAN